MRIKAGIKETISRDCVVLQMIVMDRANVTFKYNLNRRLLYFLFHTLQSVFYLVLIWRCYDLKDLTRIFCIVSHNLPPKFKCVMLLENLLKFLRYLYLLWSLCTVTFRDYFVSNVREMNTNSSILITYYNLDPVNFFLSILVY